jgi:hypothetical protein
VTIWRRSTSKQSGKGAEVLGVGNVALTAVLLKFAEMAAKLIPHWGVIFRDA